MDTKTGFESHFLNEQSGDVVFICQSDDRQSQVRVPAHKIILAAKSATFQTMFYGSLPEKGDVSLPLVSHSAFKEFLQMFYFRQATVTMANVNEVVDLAKQYQMDHGLSVCSELYKQNLSSDNFIAFYELALLYELTELKSFCEIAAPTLLTEENIINCTRAELEHILQIKQLYTDMDLVDICEKWIANSGEQRQLDAESINKEIQQEMDNFIECFDFVSMPQHKIQELLIKYGSKLTKDKLKQIIDILMVCGTPVDTPKILWCAKEREVNRRYIESNEMMTVISNKRIVLRGVGFGPIYWEDPNNLGESVYGQLVVLKDKGSDYTVLQRESFQLMPIDDDPHDERGIHLHRLATSVIFEPNQMYKIQVQLMIRDKNEIYSRSKTITPGKHHFNKKTTEILFEGDTTIASLGIGIEYVDPFPFRPMNIQ